MKCDIIAQGIINAAKNIGLKKPVIVRLKGTNVEAAVKLVQESGLNLIVSDDFADAADKAVHVADIVHQAEKVNLEITFK
jgi:succinyl-CoA synthetase beta subunit